MTDLGTDERKVAMEAIAILCHVKRVMADLLLRAAGVPDDVTSRRVLTIGPTHHRDRRDWSSFHLPADEYAARVTV